MYRASPARGSPWFIMYQSRQYYSRQRTSSPMVNILTNIYYLPGYLCNLYEFVWSQFFCYNKLLSDVPQRCGWRKKNYENKKTDLKGRSWGVDNSPLGHDRSVSFSRSHILYYITLGTVSTTEPRMGINFPRGTHSSPSKKILQRTYRLA